MGMYSNKNYGFPYSLIWKLKPFNEIKYLSPSLNTFNPWSVTLEILEN